MYSLFINYVQRATHDPLPRIASASSSFGLNRFVPFGTFRHSVFRAVLLKFAGFELLSRSSSTGSGLAGVVGFRALFLWARFFMFICAALLSRLYFAPLGALRPSVFGMVLLKFAGFDDRCLVGARLEAVGVGCHLPQGLLPVGVALHFSVLFCIADFISSFFLHTPSLHFQCRFVETCCIRFSFIPDFFFIIPRTLLLYYPFVSLLAPFLC